MNLNINPPNYHSFTGFAKYKCKPKEADELRYAIKDCLPDSFVFWDKKIGKKKTYFILTDEHADKFVDKTGKMDFWDLKENIEKIFKEKARKLDIEELKNALEKGTLNI